MELRQPKQRQPQQRQPSNAYPLRMNKQQQPRQPSLLPRPARPTNAAIRCVGFEAHCLFNNQGYSKRVRACRRVSVAQQRPGNLSDLVVRGVPALEFVLHACLLHLLAVLACWPASPAGGAGLLYLLLVFCLLACRSKLTRASAHLTSMRRPPLGQPPARRQRPPAFDQSPPVSVQAAPAPIHAPAPHYRG